MLLMRNIHQIRNFRNCSSQALQLHTFFVCNTITNRCIFKTNFWRQFSKIVYKKTDEWRRVTTSGTTSDNEWQRVVQRVTTNDNEWYNKWQRMAQRITTSDNELQRVTTNVSEWYNEWQRVTTNDNEWQRLTISVNFSFFQIREEPITKHPKENSLNLEKDLWRRSIELRAEASP